MTKKVFKHCILVPKSRFFPLVHITRQVQASHLVLVVVNGVAPEVSSGVNQQLQDVVPADGGGPVEGSLAPGPLLAACKPKACPFFAPDRAKNSVFNT